MGRGEAVPPVPGFGGDVAMELAAWLRPVLHPSMASGRPSV
jgi:hypothetical protein